MNWAMVLGAGVLAGATTCAATQGGLLVGLITRQRRSLGLPARAGVADDLTPVGGFLVGKLLSHTMLGFVLGAAGALIGFNPRLGAMAQWMAGILMITLGLGSLGVSGFRELQFTPPDSWLNVVRRSTRSTAAIAPFLLGLASILVPCGVTISMLVLAASSGSAITGAAVMALFVIGTAPMFTLIGFVTQRVPMGKVLANALGVVVVLMGVFTLNAGMVAAGSPVSAQALADKLVGSTAAAPAAAATASTNATGVQEVRIAATSNAYVPDNIKVKAGAPIRLTFTTDNTWSCIRATLMPTLGKQVILPQTGEDSIELDALEPGDYPISCSMGMYTANLHVE